jgi:phosphoesterase RecJ-like protein
LPGVGRVRQAPKEEKHDLGIIVDLDATDRLGTTEPYFAACETTIVVDHHVPHQAPGNIRIVDTGAAATAAILTKLFLAIEANITPAMATCLLTGIVTDTGSFRFRNTTAESFVLAGHLLACGADINQISEEIFQSKPAAAARLLGMVLERMHLEADDRIAWSTIHLIDFEHTGSRDEDTEGFVNELLSIESVQIAVLARETKPNVIRVSLRSRRGFDVAEVARQFGGGGHKNAAGCTLDGEIEPAVKILVERLKQCLASS